MFFRDLRIQQQTFAGVANRSPLRLGVDEDGNALGEVGALFKIDVAVSRPRFDDGHGRVFNGVADEPRPAARDQHVYDPVHSHKLRGAFMGSIFDQLDKFRIISCRADGVLDDLRHRSVGENGVLASAQDDGVPALDGKPDRIRRHVGARLIDYAEHAQRNAHAPQLQSVVQGALFQDFADGTMKLHELFQPFRNAVDPLFVQHQAVGKLCAARAVLHVLCVFRNDQGRLFAQGRGSSRQHFVHVLFACKRDGGEILLCFQTGFFDGHNSSCFPLFQRFMTRRVLCKSLILPLRRQEVPRCGRRPVRRPALPACREALRKSACVRG